ncbi:hypothetical protein CC1G_03961 [Coprinopsis cinerea okayama7|uniref:Uncharacterized protein n=1 Tax=Coprinopsis cinerea (strain Okayama-7 / 130 / ATCC MYA-4618 / FGSC 9003) TaxID=240176 RepID=A8N8B4_COPC7|nr:hypothetical protein CC1G_03961 [Coprinopsis cinerea okayama7\|eukprot:XP_001831070.1 hypothetical protein CC1G_03961 [Coprinopsis cinerea okayama7\
MRHLIAITTVLSGFLLSSTLAQNDGGAVTLFWPKLPTTTLEGEPEWNEGITTLGGKVLSTDAEGYTHYAVSHVQTLGVVDGETYISTPTSVTYTFRADASRYRGVGPFAVIEPTGTVGGGLGLTYREGAQAITECEGDIDGSSEDTDEIACSMRVEFAVASTDSDSGSAETVTSVRTREMWTVTGEKEPMITIAASESGAVSALRMSGALVWSGIAAGGMVVWLY